MSSVPIYSRKSNAEKTVIISSVPPTTIFVERAYSSAVNKDGQSLKHKRRRNVGVSSGTTFPRDRCCVVWGSFVCDITRKRFEITKEVCSKENRFANRNRRCVCYLSGRCVHAATGLRNVSRKLRERELDRSYSWHINDTVPMFRSKGKQGSWNGRVNDREEIDIFCREAIKREANRETGGSHKLVCSFTKINLTSTSCHLPVATRCYPNMCTRPTKRSVIRTLFLPGQHCVCLYVCPVETGTFRYPVSNNARTSYRMRYESARARETLFVQLDKYCLYTPRFLPLGT